MRNDNGLFYVEHLNDSKDGTECIAGFRVEPRDTGYGLESYLKEWAAHDEESNEARTYLVRDCATCELVAYFSLKAGSITINEDEEGGFDTIPGIELANFAVNSAYRDVHGEVTGIGSIVFMDFIIPIIRDVVMMLGVKILYIYALPYEGLLNYYHGLAFSRLPKEQEMVLHSRIKPRYDEGCIFMYQVIGKAD